MLSQKPKNVKQIPSLFQKRENEEIHLHLHLGHHLVYVIARKRRRQNIQSMTKVIEVIMLDIK